MLTAGELREVLNYGPATGIFTWRISNSNRAPVGAIAGSTPNEKMPYRQIRINKKTFYAHRLAWLYVYGCWPKEQIDHINGDKKDNRIANLREASSSQNGMNRGASPNNKSGLKGVSWNKRDKRWYAFIKINRKSRGLGCFGTAEAAHAAYCRAAGQLHGEFARGQG